MKKKNPKKDPVILQFGKAINPQDLFRELEEICNRAKVSYADAIIHYCHIHNLEVETVAEVVKKNSKILSSIREEYENLNMLPKSARLPV